MTVVLTPAEHAEVLRQMPGPIYLTVEGERESSFLSGEHFVVPDKWLIASRAERVELRVTCPVMVDGHHPAEHDGALCWHCDGTGSVLFAHVTVEVLPVVDHSLRGGDRSGVEAGDSEGNHVGPCTLWDNGQWSPITLDPLPVPGRDWIVILDGLVLA